MHPHPLIGNALLWAGAIVVSGIPRAPGVFSLVILPALSVCSLGCGRAAASR